MPSRSTLTACLLNWRRPGQLRRIVDCLAGQSLRPEIFVWNNSGQPFSHSAVGWQVDSSRNLVCWPRWWMALQASTEWVMTCDDDLIPTDDRLLEDAVAFAASLPAGTIVGPTGAAFRRGGRYRDHREVFARSGDNVPVDVVKGRMMLLRRADLAAGLTLSHFLEGTGADDDIGVSAAVGGGRPLAHLVPPLFAGRVRNLHEAEEALSRRPGHMAERDVAGRRWFGGGKLIGP